MPDPDDTIRIGILERLQLFDSPREPEYDDLVELALRVTGARMACLAFVDRERHWTKASAGFPPGEAHRGESLCGLTIATGVPVIVEDASVDPRLAANPLVTGEAGVRLYVAHPVRGCGGVVLGSLAVMDRLPGTLDAPALEGLERLARQAGRLLDARLLTRVRRRGAGIRTAAGEQVSAPDAVTVPHIPGMLYRCRADSAWSMLFVSVGARELTGYLPEDLVDDRRVSYASLILPEDRERAEHEVRAAVHEGKPYSVRYRLRAADGETRWVWEQGAAVAGPGPTSVLEGFISDITPLVRAEDERDALLAAERTARAEAERARSHFRSLFESAPGAYLVLTPPDYRIDAVSEAYLRATNTTRESLRGRLLFDAFPDDPGDAAPEGARSLRASLDRAMQRRHADVMAVQRYPIQRPASEGGGFEERFWSVINSPVLGPGGEVEYIIHRVEDVTEYVKTKEAAGDSSGGFRLLESRREQMEADIVLRSRELRELNAQLQASERRVAETFRAASAGIALADASGRYVMANPAFCDMVGYTEEELRKHTFESITHPEDYPGDALQLEALRTGEVDRFVIQKRYLRKDGREVWVRASRSALRRSDGTLESFIAVVEDITAERAAEERARQNAALLRIGGRMARVGGWSADLRTDVVHWSDEIFGILDFPGGETPPLSSTFDLYAPESRARLLAALERSARDGTPFDLELDLRTYAGRELRVRAAGEAERDAGGTITRLIGAFQDVSAAYAAARELRESRERFEIAVAGSQAALWDWRPPGPEMYFSPRLFEMLGYAPGELPATVETFFDQLHPDDRARTREAIRAHLEHDVPYRIEYRLRTRAGDHRWFAAAGKALRDREGRPYRMAGSLVDVTEQHAAQEAVRQLAETRLTTLESITDAFFTLDTEWRFTFLNRRAEDLLARRRVELLGRRVWDEFPEAVGSVFEAEYERAARTGEAAEFEAHFAPLAKWFRVRAYPSSQGLAVYFQDVTEDRKVHASLIASEERFRLLSRATNDAIWDWDLAAGTLWWNDGYQKLFGYAPSERPPGIGSWQDHIHPEDRPRVLEAIHEAIDSGQESWSDEYRFRHRDGHWVFVLDRGHVIRDADGTPVRMIGGMTDITARRESEDRLKKQAALLDQANDAILERDLDHHILFWSRGAEKLYGYTAAEVLGRGALELLYDDRGPMDEAIRILLAEGEWSGELEQRTKSGARVIVFGRWTLVRDERGLARSVLAINSDVTERKRIEQHFLRAQRMESIGTLAGGVAHDLNNVLAPILLAIGMLKLEETDASKLESLDAIEASAQRGADMVRQVLSFARGAEGRRIELRVPRVVADVLKIVRDTFPKDIALQASVPDDLWIVRADPTQLHQVLLNLCVNARDAMPSGGVLHASAQNRTIDAAAAQCVPGLSVGPYVVLELRDTGTGMDPELLERIFDPFFTTKAPGRGTGLGLSTSLAIIRSHGGVLRVDSEPGAGSSFRIFLPALPGVAAKGSDDEGAVMPRGHGELVLVVDDEEVVRRITRETLEAFGYRVLEAEDGREALATFERHRGEVAVVLTDMMMPVMDGLATIKALVATAPAVRIVAASGLALEGRVHQAAKAGVRHFLPKPYTASTLLRILRRALDEPVRESVRA
jgi:PAS domain S-box-containing protein